MKDNEVKILNLIDGDGEVLLNDGRKLAIHSTTILGIYRHHWSWKKFRFDWWMERTGFFPDFSKLKVMLKKDYNIEIRK